MLEIILLILAWFGVGALGVYLARRKWFRVFGDYENCEWTCGLSVFTIIAGPAGLFGAGLWAVT